MTPGAAHLAVIAIAKEERFQQRRRLNEMRAAMTLPSLAWQRYLASLEE